MLNSEEGLADDTDNWMKLIALRGDEYGSAKVS